MCEGFASIPDNDVILLCFGNKTREFDDYKFYNVKNNFNIIKLKIHKSIPFKTIFVLPQILYYLLKIKPDMVVGRYTYGIFASTFLNFSSILEIHSPLWEISKLQWFLYKLIYKHSKYKNTVIISNVLKRIYENKDKNLSTKLLVLHDCATLPENYLVKFNNEVRKIGYVGSLYKGKGVDIVLKIAKILFQYEFVIIGGNSTQIEGYRNISSGNVEFKGFIPQEKLADIYASLDIVLLPNQRDVYSYGKEINIGSYTSPLKLFEYLAHSKPLISSKLPVLEEILEHNKNAILVDPEDIDEWVNAILNLKDINERIRISSNGYQMIVTSYNWTSRARKIIKSFNYEN